MPNNDGTGPNGQGPKTGRGMGNCETIEKIEEVEEILENNISTNNTNSGKQNLGKGQGLGRGRRCCGKNFN